MLAVQLASLAVATDILGADVSDFATPRGATEATGTESDIDETAQEDTELAIGAFELPQQFIVPEQTTTTAAPTTSTEASTELTATTPSTTPATTATTTAPVTTPADQPSSTSAAPAASTPTTQAASTEQTAAPVEAGTVTTQAAAATEATTPPAGQTSTSLVQQPTTTQSQGTTSSTVAPTTEASTPAGQSNNPTTSSSVPASTTSSTVPATSTSTTTTTVLTTTTTAPPPTTTEAPPATSATTTTTVPTTTTSTTLPPTTTTTTAPTTTTTVPPTTAAPTTTTTIAPTTTTVAQNSSANNGLEAMRNNNSLFSQFASVPSASLNLNALTEPVSRTDNGSVGDGQFRAACEYSHFAYDDPIIYPNQPGRSHLHMFFGNTETDAHTTTNSLVNRGGGSCNGFELNRSGYWTPALLDGRGNAIVPDAIILYYKSKQPGIVQRMPQGLKMVSGNATAESFTTSEYLHWSCGGSGAAYNKTNRIPNCNGDYLNATIVFPQCWDGQNMDSADHRSHMALVSPHVDCPSSHPVRLPQISILLYFPSDGFTNDWHLSSDRSGGFNTGNGATLHADWWGGWNDEAMDLWTGGCMHAVKNCSFGQTGTPRQLAKLNNFQTYQGPNIIPMP